MSGENENEKPNENESGSGRSGGGSGMSPSGASGMKGGDRSGIGGADLADAAPVRFDTKITVVLRDDLEPWQRLNVTAFLVSGLGTTVPEVIGEPYEDADGVSYLPMFRQPVLVLEASKETLTAAHGRALSRALPRAVFTSDLFGTGNDRDNRAAVRAVQTGGLDLVGVAVYGPRNAVDKVVKGARMHP